jgi:hypothetical protein
MVTCKARERGGSMSIFGVERIGPGDDEAKRCSWVGATQVKEKKRQTKRRFDRNKNRLLLL